MERVGWQHPVLLQPRPAVQQTPAQQAWSAGQQVVPPWQTAEPLGHWQPAVALTQSFPPAHASPQCRASPRLPSQTPWPK